MWAGGDKDFISYVIWSWGVLAGCWGKGVSLRPQEMSYELEEKSQESRGKLRGFRKNPGRERWSSIHRFEGGYKRGPPQHTPYS